MRRPITAVLALLAGCAGTAALAQAPVASAPRIATLIRADAALRERIGQLRLDALLARVDRETDRKAPAHADRGASLRRDIALYSY